MRIKFILLLILSAVLLTGCSSSIRDNNMVDTTDSQVTIGNLMIIKTPDNDLKLYDNKDILSMRGMYYTTWTIGNPMNFVNEDGDTVDIYDAQLYLLLKECPDTESAISEVSAWKAMEAESNDVLKTEDITCNDQSYALHTYKSKNDTNPYSNGISAFAVHNNLAICVEIYGQENFSGNMTDIITEFLNGCSYNK